MNRIKIACLLVFAAVGIVGMFTNSPLVTSALSSSHGPPTGFTGAPDENSCSACHSGPSNSGQFAILDAPPFYIPGRSYQVRVKHTTNDLTRLRWGFEMTSLVGSSPAGNFTNLDGTTQVLTDNGRSYIEHTFDGIYTNQTGGAEWAVSWTAPSSNMGAVSLYAAGNQADNSHTTDGDQIYTTNVTIAAPRPTAFDFDGDYKTDISIFRPNGATGSEWWYLKSSNGGNYATQFGTPTDKLVAADYTGDGKADIAFWRPSTGEWFILRSEDSSFYAFPFGANGDIPAPADFDGDGKADAAVFRPSTATWFIQNSGGGTTIQAFGAAGDVPVVGDYDGDGKADVAIFRPNGATGSEWWILRSTAGLIATQFGTPTDKTVPGDYTGDGKADIAIWRPSNGQWYILRSEDLSFYAFPFGANGDIPVPGDYDGDGKTDAAVFRPSSSTWFAQGSTSGTIIQQFGAAGDVPVPSEFVR